MAYDWGWGAGHATHFLGTAQAMRMHTQGCSRDPALYAARGGGGPRNEEPPNEQRIAGAGLPMAALGPVASLTSM